MVRRGGGVRVAAVTCAVAAVTGLGTAAPALPGGAGGGAELPRRPASTGHVLADLATAAVTFADARCTDPAASWMGAAWRTPLRWRFAAGTTPRYLGRADAVQQAISDAADGLTAGHNDCQLPPLHGMSARYAGATRARAGVTADGRCGRRDGRSVLSFGPLAAGLLAVTCIWWQPAAGPDGRIVEADIRISDEPGLFLLDLDGACSDRYDLKSALTHEFGHAFGLGHVAAASHPGQVMGDVVPACDARHRALGRGDYEMLRRHYDRR